MVGLYRESMEILEDLCKDEAYGRSLITVRVAIMEVSPRAYIMDAAIPGRAVIGPAIGPSGVDGD